MSTSEYGFRSYDDEAGAQIDLCLDRKDGIINICEDKFTNEDSYILVDSNDQIMMDIGQKVDGKSIRKVKVKKED